MEKTEVKARMMLMTEEDLDCLELLVLQQLHDIKEMKKCYTEACSKRTDRDCKAHFLRHKESLESNAKQTLEYSCSHLPLLFQTADVPDSPHFASCSKHCSQVSVDTALHTLMK